MKKTIIASSLAVGLGVVAGNTGHDAHASEATNVDKAKLAQKAQTNDQSLNDSPIQQGAYNINFNYNGYTYHFESDGSNWSWSYEGSGQSTPAHEDVSEQPTPSINQASAQEVSSQQPSTQVSAPQTEQTQQPQTQSTTSSSKASSGSSVNVNSHLQQIAQRESGGDIHAINPSSGAAGKYQFLQSTWDSIAPSEYKGQSPANAPESVQDAAAVKLYNSAGANQWVTA
ncbi:transglycosylase family protein [Staphylococcus saccharolyticus]|uniref:transglycosylase family protein n=1 Tax=Staphylococcus saccharolyticus TaxID=33028 RepID=UPI00102DF1F9|nr:transglycosylase family protein [Staphylococcus saccharolyticus]MBL7574171.1 transglycosylase family protein [Staphylococcus saccharolyticus]MBL7585173.1 transglycosylase family protein [Staphylococcus saccharolyticus]MBL7639783.1 transglycosylase family protein [Staphylococcus saccharolyticus]QRJ68925.1 transglycosylase family protein [Staphylococcus saccharolyticus]TAA91032.1 transglycosylase [Staphylococcus saccharolyticus]